MQPDTPDRANVRVLSLAPGPCGRTRRAGVFLFRPLLTAVPFDQRARVAGYPGSQCIPTPAALLSLLLLKRVDKERRSHVNDFNFDTALGLFAGLNILPKKSFLPAYS